MMVPVLHELIGLGRKGEAANAEKQMWK